MAPRYTLDDLTEYITPSAWRAEGFDWRRDEQAIDSTLPSDYENFMRSYGPGGIAGYLYIEPPMAVDGLQGMSVPEGDLLADMESPYPAFPEPGGLVYLGGDSDADVIFYLAEGNPDEWAIVVRRRHNSYNDTGWRLYRCGLVDFLVRMFRREFDGNPLSGNDLWGRGRHELEFQSDL